MAGALRARMIRGVRVHSGRPMIRSPHDPASGHARAFAETSRPCEKVDGVHQNGIPSSHSAHPAARFSTGTIAFHREHDPTRKSKYPHSAQGVTTGMDSSTATASRSASIFRSRLAGVIVKVISDDLRVASDLADMDGGRSSQFIDKVDCAVFAVHSSG